MEKLIGQTRAKQDKRLKERMERRKRAKAEGKTEEEIRREEEEEDQKTQNDVQKGSDVIKDLQSQFQAEKDAILGITLFVFFLFGFFLCGNHVDVMDDAPILVDSTIDAGQRFCALGVFILLTDLQFFYFIRIKKYLINLKVRKCPFTVSFACPI